MEEQTPEEQSAENGPTVSQDQLQEMLDRLQKLMEEGKSAEAAELLAQIQEMMENMRMVQGGGQGQGQGGPGQQAMRDLGETLRGQQGLSDDAFRDMQRDRRGEGEGEGQPGEPEDGAPQDGEGQESQPGEGQGQEGQSLAERQEDLRRQLERMEQENNLPGAGNERGEEGRRRLQDARRAMREAEEDLRDGDLPGALDRQAEALEALREGIRNLGEAMAQENRREGQAEGGRQATSDDAEGRDPLGRQRGESLRIGSDNNLLQDKDIYRRAEELLDEIRRRSGDLARPEGERDYLKRLLDLF